MNRNGALLIVDERGREVERYPIGYGSTLLIPDGGRCEEGQKIAQWDPYTFAILTEIGGTIAWRDLVDGVTVHESAQPVPATAPPAPGVPACRCTPISVQNSGFTARLRVLPSQRNKKGTR